MDSDTRIKVLGRLAHSNTSAADDAIGRACEHAFAALAERNEYDTLEFSIEVLATVGFRRSKKSVPAIADFMRSVETRNLVYSAEYDVLGEAWSKYRNAFSLISKCIEVLSTLRYLETSAVVDVLLWASAHTEQIVRKDALSALRGVAKYDLSVYYGAEGGTRNGIGANPQILIMNTLERKNEEDLKLYFQGVITLLEGLLSTSMESATWSSTALTLSRATIPADEGVFLVRQRSISLAQKLYSLFETRVHRLSVINVLNIATRIERRGSEDKAYADMISANTLEVLAFFKQLANSQDLQIIQKLEHDTYWIHYRSASDHVRSAALEVKDFIDANTEYSIYKTLVGFEGIFGDWAISKRDESFELGSQDFRRKAALLFVSRIEEDGFEIWRNRILTFAMTESDDLATFPVFYEFLAEVALTYPTFALGLLFDDSERLSKFLIPILRGLWDGEKRNEVRLLIKKWVADAQSETTNVLYSCTKVFLSTKDVDVELLRLLLEKGTQLKDAYVLRQVASVAIARSAMEEYRSELKTLFLRALSHLTELKDAAWVRDIWFRDEAKRMIAEFATEEHREVLRNLYLLPQIDYQAEEVLAVIAKGKPQEVLDFLCSRVYKPDDAMEEPVGKRSENYEDLPFQFNSLQEPLSGDPHMVIQTLLRCYRKDPVLFEFKGARLILAIFPVLSESMQKTLVRVIHDGGDSELAFVSGILQAYNGEAFIHPVARELIKRLPAGSRLLTEIKIALENTGVVSGEFGMAEAYERKRLDALDWLRDPNDRIQKFAAEYIAELESMRDSERVRSEESIILHKFNYGED